MLKSLFHKVTGLKTYIFIKETPTQVFYCEYCEIFKNTYFKEHLSTNASEEITFSLNIKVFYRFILLAAYINPLSPMSRRQRRQEL